MIENPWLSHRRPSEALGRNQIKKLKCKIVESLRDSFLNFYCREKAQKTQRKISHRGHRENMRKNWKGFTGDWRESGGRK
jgi:hypothetical protein